MNDKGYLLPGNLEPENDACIVLFYPDDELYRRALLGAYGTMGAWVVWEKKGDNSAAIAAQRWKQAIIKTQSTKVDCEILELLDEEGNMAINIQMTNNQSCCCGGAFGGGDGGDIWTPPPAALPEDNVLPYIPPGVDAPSDVATGMTEQQLCDTGKYLASLFVGVWLDAETYWQPLTITSGAVLEWWKSKLSTGGGGIPPAATMTTWLLATLSGALSAALLGGWLARTSDAAQQFENDFACSIARSATGAEAKSKWHSVLAQVRLTYGNATYSLLWIASHLWNWDKVMAGDVPIPLEFTGSVCSCDEDAEYIWTADFTAPVSPLGLINSEHVATFNEGEDRIEFWSRANSNPPTEGGFSLNNDILNNEFGFIPGAGHKWDFIDVWLSYDGDEALINDVRIYDTAGVDFMVIPAAEIQSTPRLFRWFGSRLIATGDFYRLQGRVIRPPYSGPTNRLRLTGFRVGFSTV